MRDVGLVAGVIVTFFVIGIGVGVIAMIALSALKYRRLAQRDYEDDDGYGDQPPRWPGG